MRKSNTNKRRTSRVVLLSIFAVILVAFGLWFGGSNAFKFTKGYFLFKAEQPEADSNQSGELKQDRTSKEKYGLYSDKPEIGEMIGHLSIPKLNANLPIYHGTDEDELEQGVGHFAGSVLPGEKDNTVLSGHRDTVFRKLGEVGKGDLLTVSTEAGDFTYKIRKVKIVEADDRTIIVPKPRATLTVTTCYPFNYIGDAPQRYILVADLVKQ